MLSNLFLSMFSLSESNLRVLEDDEGDGKGLLFDLLSLSPCRKHDPAIEKAILALAKRLVVYYENENGFLCVL